MAGDGEVIPNGSIHWRIRHRSTRPNTQPTVTPAGNAGCSGIDPSDPASHPILHVRLRFRTRDEAMRALGAMPLEDTNTTMWVVDMDVPLATRTQQQANEPQPNEWAQLSYNWGP